MWNLGEGEGSGGIESEQRISDVPDLPVHAVDVTMKWQKSKREEGK